MKLAWMVSLLPGLALLSGCGSSAFTCLTDNQCMSSDGGRCEETGFCSFPDEACDSGRRYGSFAGGGLAGVCTDEADDTDSGSATTASTTGSGSATSAGSMTTMGSSDSNTTLPTTSGPTTTGPLGNCGDGVVEFGELCEPGLPLPVECSDLGLFDGGTLDCAPNCQFDLSGCTSCGNGDLEPGEACDGQAFPNDVSCQSEGFAGGTLDCTESCEIDTNPCNNCGNGVIDDEEVCDGDATAGVTCADLGLGISTEIVPCASAGCNAFNTSSCGDLTCESDQDVPWATGCPSICDSCMDGTCLIECNGASSCSSATIDCPAGFNCAVQCSGTSACSSAEINCAPHVGCSVRCDGTTSCSSAELNCSADGMCSMDCVDGTSVCSSADVHCGGDSCVATCGIGVSAPNVECGQSCDCEDCTGGGG